MRRELRCILREFKADIVNSLTAGAVLSLTNELGIFLADSDRQKIECDSARVGPSWACDSLIDCLKSSEDRAFTKFLQFLKTSQSTKDLLAKIESRCRCEGLDFILPGLQERKRPAVKFENKKEAARMLLKELSPIIVQDFTEGNLADMLRHFEEDLTEESLQKIKCTLNNEGKNRAVAGTINCLLNCGRRSFKKFIKYIYENKKYVFEDVKLKCNEYNLTELLPFMGEELADEMSSTEIVEAQSNGDYEGCVVSAPPSEELAGLKLKETELTNEDSQQFDEVHSPVNIITNPQVSSSVEKLTNIDVYEMSKKPQGICLIVNNENFGNLEVKGLKNRLGSSVDEANLDDVFSWLRFDVVIHRDKKAMEMWEIFQGLSKFDHSMYDCLVVCVLSHGARKNNADYIIGVDGERFPVNNMIELFSGKNCSTLIGKPKLFFLQVCRGRMEDGGVVAKGTVNPKKSVIQHDGVDRIPEASDCFIGYSTPPGFKSWRSTETGSWYISTLCKVFRDMANNFDLLSMMTKVNDTVSNYITDEACCQIPNPSMTLRKLLYFRPRS